MKKNILMTFILLNTFNGFSQQMTSFMNERSLQIRVKQVDEFMARFNFEETVDGTSVENRADITLRKESLFSLFDKDSFQYAADTITGDAMQFINKVITDDIRLRYEDTTWVAELICKANFNGKPCMLSLFLKPEKIQEFEYKWIIVDAKGDMLNIDSVGEETIIMISPAEHEIGFMSLPSAINRNAKNITQYSFRDFRQDRLSVFNALIYLGLLKINVVQSVNFHFYTVPDYTFTISRIEKENSDNTGWLITSLKKMCEQNN